MNYNLKLKTGTCLVRRIFKNTNGKNKLTVQFQQFKNNRPVTQSTNTGRLAAMANGMDPIEEGTNATTLMSFAPGVLSTLGFGEGDYYDGSNPVVHASQLWPSIEGDLNIQIVENTTPAYFGQQPKINPETKEILCLNGAPIYVHDDIVEGEPNDVYVRHTDTMTKEQYDSYMSAQVKTGQPVPEEVQ